MSKAQTLRLIDDAYRALEPLNNIKMTAYRDEIARLATIEEKMHRRAPRPGFAWGLTVAQAARLFTVKRIAEALQKPDRYSIADVLSIQPSAIYAAAVVASFPVECAQLLSGFAPAVLADLDYAALVDGGQR